MSAVELSSALSSLFESQIRYSFPHSSFRKQMQEEASYSFGLLLSDDDLPEDDSYVVEEPSGLVEISSEIDIYRVIFAN